MHLRPPLRTASLVAAGALAAASLAAFSPPASAVVISAATTEAHVAFDFFPTSGACTQNPVVADADQSVPFAADGVAKTASAASSATVTHNTDATDVTTLNGSTSSTVTATQSAGQLDKVVVSTSYSASVSSTLGTAQKCGADVSTSSGANYTFDLVAPAYVTVTLDARGGQAQAIAAQDLSGGTSQIAVAAAIGVGAAHVTSTGTALLPAGPNNIGMNFQADSLDAPTPGFTTTSRSGNAKMTLTFQTPGIATTAAAGDGKKYLALDGGRNCSAGTLAGKWKNKAGKGDSRKIKKAVFYVNDVKVKSVKKPKKKSVTTLTGLNAELSADVRVVMKLAKKGAGKVTLERAYLPCK